MEKINRNPIKLREKKLADGSSSLYLDIYLNGVRKYEYLKIYLLAIPENCSKKEAKEIAAKNAESRKLAEAILSRRIYEYNEHRVGASTDKSYMLLSSVFEKFRADAKESIKRYYDKCLKDIFEYTKGKDVRLSDIDYDFCQGFVNFLIAMPLKCYRKDYDSATKKEKKYIVKPEDRRKTISTATVRLTLSPLKTVLKKCVKFGYITSNPMDSVDLPKLIHGEKEYLSMDEIKKLMDTPYKYSVRTVPQAFLFSCFTGLRYSDIRTIRWFNIREVNGVTLLDKGQVKTKNHVTIVLNKKAIEIAGERKGDNDLVFEGLPVSIATVERQLKRWIEDAGITRNITMHCARHTHAVTLLSLGTDIYTVSKILGHSSVRTTEIYARLVDQKRQDAASAMDKAFE